LLPNDFCIFIMSHGRPDNIQTIHTLERLKYTGQYYILIDNEDKTSNQYYEKYGNKVIMFDKLKISKEFDQADNFDNRKTVVYARNYCFKAAKDLNIKYFMEFDDDYTNFGLRFTEKGEFKHIHLYDTLDKLFLALLNFYKKAKNITCLAFAQDGDFIGGAGNVLGKNICMKRKAMNTQLCSIDRPFTFLGRINEDVNTYVKLGSVGKLFLTVSCVSIGQITTQSNDGGMTDIYKDQGTYVKSFYTIMYCPSCVKISKMGVAELRIHHKIFWKNAVPYIIDEKHKKLF